MKNIRYKEMFSLPIQSILTGKFDKLIETRISTCFKYHYVHEINTLKDLLILTDEDLLHIRNFGSKCLTIIKEIIKDIDPNLHLGMTENEINALIEKDKDFEDISMFNSLSQDEKEELYRVKNDVKQKEEEAKKAEFMVEIARENYNNLSNMIERKQKALHELQLLKLKNQQLLNESDQLDVLIIEISNELGIKNIEESEIVETQKLLTKKTTMQKS